MRRYIFITLLVCGLQCYIVSNGRAAVIQDSSYVSATDSIRHFYISNTLQKADTLVCERRGDSFLSQAVRSKLFKSTYIGVPLVIGGLIEKHQDTKFRRLRNDYMPMFRRHIDDYTQYLPAAVMLGLKTAGVESRSSWGRMLLGDAFSVALMAGTVQMLKTTTKVERPDGSNNQSFPSGHTATAFMTATMLSREYGHKSALISIGAYGVATAIGLMRMANNKHWLSDVMVGAGIGILSTEFGYWIADAICKDRGLNVREKQEEELIACQRKPSFVGLYMGFNLPLSKYDINEDNAFQTSTGTTIGLEGAWFLNRNIGIGGRASVSNLQYIVNGTDAPDNTFKFYSVMAGPYFNLPLANRWSIGSKLVAGEVWYPKTVINNIGMGNNHGFIAGSGISLNYQVRSHLAGSLFLDYNVQAPASRNSGEYMHLMTLGAKVSIKL